MKYKLTAAVIRASLDRIRLCPTEIGTPITAKTSLDETGTPGIRKDKTVEEIAQKIPDVTNETSQATQPLTQSLPPGSSNSVWTGWLQDQKLRFKYFKCKDDAIIKDSRIGARGL